MCVCVCVCVDPKTAALSVSRCRVAAGTYESLSASATSSSGCAPKHTESSAALDAGGARATREELFLNACTALPKAFH